MKRHQILKKLSSLIIFVALCNDLIFESSAYLADFIKEIDLLDTPKDLNLPFTLKMIIKFDSILSEKYGVNLSSEYAKLHQMYHSTVLSSKFYKNDTQEMHQNIISVALNHSKIPIPILVPKPATVRMKIAMGKNEKCDPAEIENCFLFQYLSKFSSHFGMVVFSLAEILELVNHLNLQSSLVEANGFQKTLSNKNAHIFLGNLKELQNLYHDRVLNSKLKTEQVPPGFKFLRNFRVKFGIDLTTGQIFTEHLEKMIKVGLQNQQTLGAGFIELGEAVKNGRFSSPYILREKFMSMGTFEIRHHYMKMDKPDNYGHEYIGAAYNLAVAASRVHNFSWVMSPYPMNTRLREDGSWTGYMGDLIDDKIFSFTFHAGPYGCEIETSFTTWSYVSAVEFLRGRPTVSINWTALYKPFSRSVWSLILVTLVLLIIVFTLIQIPKDVHSDMTDTESSILITMMRAKSRFLTAKLRKISEQRTNMTSNSARFELTDTLTYARQRGRQSGAVDSTVKNECDNNELEEIQQDRKTFELAQDVNERANKDFQRNQKLVEDSMGNSSSNHHYYIWSNLNFMTRWKMEKLKKLENGISRTSETETGKFHDERRKDWKRWNAKTLMFKMAMIHRGFLWAVAPLLSQGGSRIPTKGRFLSIIWIFMSLVLSNFYQSDLLSLITIPTPEPTPQTFEELDQRSDMKVTLMYLPGIPCDLFFRYTKIPLFVRLNTKLERIPDHLECVRKVVTEPKRVCIGWHTIIMPIAGNTLTIHRQIQSTFFSKDNALFSPVSTSVKKNSRWEGAMREVTAWLRDTGHIEQWKDDVKNYVEGLSIAHFKEHAKNKGPADQMSAQRHLEDMLEENSSANKAKPFTLELLATPFGILAFGSFVASLFFISENRRKILCLISSKVHIKWRRRKQSANLNL